MSFSIKFIGYVIPLLTQKLHVPSHRYEAHAGILEAENTSLRDQNIALELRLLDLLRQSTTAVPRKATLPAAAAAIATATPRNENQQLHHQLGQEEEDGMFGTTAASFAGDNGAASSRFRVDGRVTRPVRGDSSPGRGAPMCAAVLKTLRRRLKEAELEARAMRAERAAADKRERLVSGTGCVSRRLSEWATGFLLH